MLPLAGTGWELHSGGSHGLAQRAQGEPEPLVPMCSPCSPSSSCAPSCGPGGSHGVPAPRRGLPAAPGSRAQPQGCLGPKAQEFAIETEKTKKRNQDSPTPRAGRGDSNSTSFMDEPSFPRLHQDTPEPCSSPLHLLASPTLLDAKGKGEQLSSSSPPPGLAHLGLTESTAGRGPPWSHGLETQCSWQLPGASAAWPSVGTGAWQEPEGDTRLTGDQGGHLALLALPNQPCWKAP